VVFAVRIVQKIKNEDPDIMREMPFWDHVYELRNRVIISLLCVLLFSIIGYYLFPSLVLIVKKIAGEEFYATAITEGFVARLEGSIAFGFLLSLPILLIQIVLFVLPALDRKQQAWLFSVVGFVFVLFLGGLIFALKKVLPVSIAFLKSEAFFPGGVSRLISYAGYLRFFFRFLVGFGLIFEFPVILVALMKFRVLSPGALVKNIKFFLPLIFLVAAFITPGPDVMSQLMLAFPMVAMYLLCIGIGRLFKLGI